MLDIALCKQNGGINITQKPARCIQNYTEMLQMLHSKQQCLFCKKYCSNEVKHLLLGGGNDRRRNEGRKYFI